MFANEHQSVMLRVGVIAILSVPLVGTAGGGQVDTNIAASAAAASA